MLFKFRLEELTSIYNAIIQRQRDAENQLRLAEKNLQEITDIVAEKKQSLPSISKTMTKKEEKNVKNESLEKDILKNTSSSISLGNALPKENEDKTIIADDLNDLSLSKNSDDEVEFSEDGTFNEKENERI